MTAKLRLPGHLSEPEGQLLAAVLRNYAEELEACSVAGDAGSTSEFMSGYAACLRDTAVRMRQAAGWADGDLQVRWPCCSDSPLTARKRAVDASYRAVGERGKEVVGKNRSGE